MCPGRGPGKNIEKLTRMIFFPLLRYFLFYLNFYFSIRVDIRDYFILVSGVHSVFSLIMLFHYIPLLLSSVRPVPSTQS